MSAVAVTLVPHPPDPLLDVLRQILPSAFAQLSDGQLVVLVVGRAGEVDEVAATIRKALATRKPGRPRTLSETDLFRARGLVAAGYSIRNAAEQLGVSKSALDRALRGYGVGHRAGDDSSLPSANETFPR